MKWSSLAGGFALALSMAPAAWSGPADLNVLSRQLADLEVQIRSTEGRMRDALENRSGAAGDEGAQLRALKRDWVRVKQALQRATLEERQRETGSTGMPGRRPAVAPGPSARPAAPEQTPKVEVAPSGAPVPAPSL